MEALDNNAIFRSVLSVLLLYINQKMTPETKAIALKDAGLFISFKRLLLKVNT